MQSRNKTPLVLLVSAMLACSGAAIADSHGGAKMTTHKGAADMELASMGIEGIEAALVDITTSDENASMTCGLFSLAKSNPLVYTYTYNEAKFIVSGEMTLAEEGGETFHATAGDIIYFDKGAKITFTSDSSGLAFFCGQRAKGEL
ncbi:MAG: cupin domain-containing protein [Gammaproteobacteria bacterium]|nr:cupin domain-containing protein [Gammaproteobacteria bacterium]